MLKSRKRNPLTQILLAAFQICCSATMCLSPHCEQLPTPPCLIEQGGYFFRAWEMKRLPQQYRGDTPQNTKTTSGRSKLLLYPHVVKLRLYKPPYKTVDTLAALLCRRLYDLFLSFRDCKVDTVIGLFVKSVIICNCIFLFFVCQRYHLKYTIHQRRPLRNVQDAQEKQQEHCAMCQLTTIAQCAMI